MGITHRVEVQPAGGGLPGLPGPDWVACLRQVCGLLWPPPAVVTLEAGRPGLAGLAGPAVADGPGVREFTLVPGIRRPPLLVPAGRRAAATAVRHHSSPGSATVRLGIKALSVGMASGLGGMLRCGRVRVSVPAGADTIEEYLNTVLAGDIRFSMSLGTARANRKPVLQLLDGAGQTAGFAKVGINTLTSELVRAEQASLTRLNRAGLTKIITPRVLHYDNWHGLDVLVLSALPAWLPDRPLPASQLTAAMAELAAVDGLHREPLHASSYLTRLRSRLTAAAATAEQAALLRAIDTLDQKTGGETLTFGAWHGDWSPWNMAHTSKGLLVWDWERFTTGAPLGFDALHHHLQVTVATGRQPPRAAASRCLDQAPSQLAPFRIPATTARLTAALYLTDLATRYLADRQAQAGAARGSPGAWLIPAIASEITKL
jgi:hypothetical protein